MRAVIQRVIKAGVVINGESCAEINEGLLVFIGIEDTDNDEDIHWLSNKIINLRIFDDENKVPNISLKDLNGDLLLVSQFTLQASTKKATGHLTFVQARLQLQFPFTKK